jgi:hypothetical protein
MAMVGGITIIAFVNTFLSGGCKRSVPQPIQTMSPTQTVCRLIQDCWHRDRVFTTAVFQVMGDGQFHGERYDIWKTNGPELIYTFRGAVPDKVARALEGSSKTDQKWIMGADGVPCYKFGMVDYLKLPHPRALHEFLGVAYEQSLPPDQR